MTLDEFRKLLLTVIPDVYHFEAFKTDGKYIVWQETGVNGFYGSNRRCQIVQCVQVDFYTDDELDPMVDGLRMVLDNDLICFEEQPPVFDPDTKQIRYIFECEIMAR